MSQTDPARHFPGGNGTGARASFAVTPSDTTPLPFIARNLWVGTGGSLSVRLRDDTEPQTYLNVPDGFEFGHDVAQVYATGTTCTGIVGQY